LQPNARFAWLGGTEDKAFETSCREACTRLNLDKYVTWLGQVGDAYSSFFKCADGFVLTSTRESFSLATLEALLLGLPVVANDCGGVSEILQADIGRIIRTENRAEGMALEMDRYMKGEWKVDIQKQRVRAEAFDIEKTAPKWNEFLLEILNPAG
ncbi:MAG TPA: glycosyltransferase, partial [Bacteroidia bacterium]|nr:glycosyltransferase [Bacteroidia bacterium]